MGKEAHKMKCRGGRKCGREMYCKPAITTKGRVGEGGGKQEIDDEAFS